MSHNGRPGANPSVLVLVLALFGHAVAQFTYQVLIQPTVDPSSVLGSVGTLSGPLFGRFRIGFSDGDALGARFNNPHGVAVGSNGVAYVADAGNNAIRRVNSEGEVQTLAGGNGAGYADGVGGAARFFNPLGVAVGPSGELYVADTSNHAVRHITTSGVVTTLWRGEGHSSAEPREAVVQAEAAATSPPPSTYTYGGAETPSTVGAGSSSASSVSGVSNPQGVSRQGPEPSLRIAALRHRHAHL